MSSSTVSTFNKVFVELDEPLATSLEVRVVTNTEASLIVDLDDVPVESMEVIDTKFKTLIRDIVEEGPSHFDMEGMKNISISYFLLCYFFLSFFLSFFLTCCVYNSFIVSFFL